MTLEEARAMVQRQIYHGGIYCPTCDQWAQVYERNINRSMARSLIKLFQLDRKEVRFYHVHEWLHGHGKDQALVSFWGLIEELPNKDDPTKRTSGYWPITDKGRNFILGKITVPHKAIFYNAELLGFNTEHKNVSIQDVLKVNFDIREIVGNETHMELGQ